MNDSIPIFCTLSRWRAYWKEDAAEGLPTLSIYNNLSNFISWNTYQYTYANLGKYLFAICRLKW